MSDTTGDRRLSVLRETKRAYDVLRGARAGQWPELALVAVTVSGAETSLDDTQAWSQADTRASPSWSGWVRHRSDARTAANPARQPDDAAGPPLAGEWFREGTGMHESVHLRPHPGAPGAFQEWRYAERPLGDSDALKDGEHPALRQQVAVLARPSKEDNPDSPERHLMIYHVYWGAGTDDEPHELRRMFARFADEGKRKEFGGRPVVVRPGQAR